MIRRLAIVVLSMLIGSACAASASTSVQTGDSSLTRDEVTSLALALQGNEDATALLGPSLRQLLTAHLRAEAFTDYFESVGIEEPEGLRDAIETQVADLSTSGQIGRVEFESAEFELLVNLFVVQEQLAQTGVGTLDPAADVNFADQAAILDEFSNGFSVESRFGIWDDDTFIVVAS